jgi:hypothetical protein
MTLSWDLLGELQVSDQWQLFPNDCLSDTLRITTTITDVSGWESQRIQSGAYIRFSYPDDISSKSTPYYIRVVENPIIIELSVPHELREQGYFLRSVSCRFSSRWVGKLPLSSFAGWKLKIEVLTS